MLEHLPLIALSVNFLWFSIPPVITVSLVYAATRHEETLPILHHAFRVAVWIAGFMAVVFVILMLMQWWVSSPVG